MRLDKFLANAKCGSRKDVKKLIKNGNVLVTNNKILDESFHVKENDHVLINNRKELIVKEFVYYMLNKPSGYISATTDNYHRTVVELIDDYHEIFPVGRLDIDTVGLLFLTNDGEFCHNLTSPKKHVNKKYYVEFIGSYYPQIEEEFRQGIDLKDFTTLPASIEKISQNSCYVTIQEGKFHQVKLMMKACGLEVTYLKRVSFGEILLDENLKEGEYRELTLTEINILNKQTID